MSDSMQARQLPDDPPAPPARPDDIGNRQNNAPMAGNPLAEYGVSNLDYAHAVAIAAAESSVNPPDEEMQGILDVVANRGAFPGQYAARNGSIEGIVTARNQFDPVRGAGSSHAGNIYAATLAHALDPGRNPLPANLTGKFAQAQRAAVSVFGTQEARGITNNATFFSNPNAMSASRIAEHNTYGLAGAQVYGGTHFYGGYSGSSPEAGYSAPIHLGFAPNSGAPPARPSEADLARSAVTSSVQPGPAFASYGQDRTSAVSRGEVAPAPDFTSYGQDRRNSTQQGGQIGTSRLMSVGVEPARDRAQFTLSPAGTAMPSPIGRDASQSVSVESVLSPNLMSAPAETLDRSGPVARPGNRLSMVDGIGRGNVTEQQPERAPQSRSPSPAADRIADFSTYGQDRTSAVNTGRVDSGPPTPPSRPAGIGAPTPPSRPDGVGGVIENFSASYQETPLPGPTSWESRPDNIAESLGRLNAPPDPPSPPSDDEFSRTGGATRSAPVSTSTSYGQDRTSAVNTGRVSRSAPAPAPAPEPEPRAPDFSSYGQDRRSAVHSGRVTPQASSSAPTPPSRPSGIGGRSTQVNTAFASRSAPANVPMPPARPSGIGRPQTRLGTVNPVAPPAAQRQATRAAPAPDTVYGPGSTDRTGGRNPDISYGTGREIGLGGAFAADFGAVFGGPGRTGNRMNESTTSTGDSGGDGGGGGSTILCGHYHSRGLLPTAIYRGDLLYSGRHASIRVMAGYYAWAVPLRAHLRRNPDGLAERALRPLVFTVSRHMAWIVGAAPRTSMTGRIAFNLLRGLSWTIGGFVLPRKSPAL